MVAAAAAAAAAQIMIFGSALSVESYGCSPVMRAEGWEHTELPGPLLANMRKKNTLIIKYTIRCCIDLVPT